jgi:hypothetical protein
MTSDPTQTATGGPGVAGPPTPMFSYPISEPLLLMQILQELQTLNRQIAILVNRGVADGK